MKKILAIASVVAGLAVGACAVESSDTEKATSNDKKDENTSRVEKKDPKTVEQCEKLIAQKKEELAKADQSKKTDLLREIRELEQNLFNLKEWDRSNKK